MKIYGILPSLLILAMPAFAAQYTLDLQPSNTKVLFAPDHVAGTLSLSGSSTVKVHGIFTIHGAAHEITMDVQTSFTPDQAHATMSFDLPYVAWGMKDPSNFLLKVNKSAQMTIETSGSLHAH